MVRLVGLDCLPSNYLLGESLQKLVGSGSIEDINSDNIEVSSKELDVSVTSMENLDILFIFKDCLKRTIIRNIADFSSQQQRVY